MKDIDIRWKNYPHCLPKIRFHRRRRPKFDPIPATDGAGSSKAPKSYTLKPVADIPVYWRAETNPDRLSISSLREPQAEEAAVVPAPEAIPERNLDPIPQVRIAERVYDPRIALKTSGTLVPSAKSMATQLGPFKPNVTSYRDGKVGKASIQKSRQSLRSIDRMSSNSRTRRSRAPSIQSVVRSILSDAPSRSPSQRKALAQFAKDLARYAQKTKQLPNFPKRRLIESPSATTISANTIRELEPYRAQFASAGLAVISTEQRGVAKSSKTAFRALPGRNDIQYGGGKSSRVKTYTVPVSRGKKVKSALKKRKEPSFASGSTGTTVIGFTPPHEKSLPRTRRPGKASSLSSDHTVVGFTPPHERFAEQPISPPSNRTFIRAARQQENYSPPQEKITSKPPPLPSDRVAGKVKTPRERNSPTAAPPQRGDKAIAVPSAQREPKTQERYSPPESDLRNGDANIGITRSQQRQQEWPFPPSASLQSGDTVVVKRPGEQFEEQERDSQSPLPLSLIAIAPPPHSGEVQQQNYSSSTAPRLRSGRTNVGVKLPKEQSAQLPPIARNEDIERPRVQTRFAREPLPPMGDDHVRYHHPQARVFQEPLAFAGGVDYGTSPSQARWAQTPGIPINGLYYNDDHRPHVRFVQVPAHFADPLDYSALHYQARLAYAPDAAMNDSHYTDDRRPQATFAQKPATYTAAGYYVNDTRPQQGFVREPGPFPGNGPFIDNLNPQERVIQQQVPPLDEGRFIENPRPQVRYVQKYTPLPDNSPYASNPRHPGRFPQEPVIFAGGDYAAKDAAQQRSVGEQVPLPHSDYSIVNLPTQGSVIRQQGQIPGDDPFVSDPRPQVRYVRQSAPLYDPRPQEMYFKQPVSSSINVPPQERDIQQQPATLPRGYIIAGLESAQERFVQQAVPLPNTYHVTEDLPPRERIPPLPQRPGARTSLPWLREEAVQEYQAPVVIGGDFATKPNETSGKPGRNPNLVPSRAPPLPRAVSRPQKDRPQVTKEREFIVIEPRDRVGELRNAPEREGSQPLPILKAPAVVKEDRAQVERNRNVAPRDANAIDDKLGSIAASAPSRPAPSRPAPLLKGPVRAGDRSRMKWTRNDAMLSVKDVGDQSPNAMMSGPSKLLPFFEDPAKIQGTQARVKQIEAPMVADIKSAEDEDVFAMDSEVVEPLPTARKSVRIQEGLAQMDSMGGLILQDSKDTNSSMPTQTSLEVSQALPSDGEATRAPATWSPVNWAKGATVQEFKVMDEELITLKAKQAPDTSPSAEKNSRVEGNRLQMEGMKGSAVIGYNRGNEELPAPIAADMMPPPAPFESPPRIPERRSRIRWFGDRTDKNMDNELPLTTFQRTPSPPLSLPHIQQRVNFNAQQTAAYADPATQDEVSAGLEVKDKIPSTRRRNHRCSSDSFRCEQCHPSGHLSPQFTPKKAHLSSVERGYARWRDDVIDKTAATAEPLDAEEGEEESMQRQLVKASIEDFAKLSPVADPEKRPSLPNVFDRFASIAQSTDTRDPPDKAAQAEAQLPRPKLQQPQLKNITSPFIANLATSNQPDGATNLPLLTQPESTRVTSSYDTQVFKGLHVATAAASDEDIDTWIEQVTGVGIRKFLVDLSVFEGLGVNSLASIARRAKGGKGGEVRRWEREVRLRKKEGDGR